MNNSNSQSFHQRALNIMPGGVNSPVRAFQAVGLTPIYIAKASGSKIVDVDGNEYIDYVNSWGPLIFGHCDKDVAFALEETLKGGTSFGAPTTLEIKLAELVLEFFPCLEKVRMTNSGTEAVLGAIRVARAFSGKDKIIKFNGCYHGHGDYLLVKAGSGASTLGSPDSKGVPESYTKDTICLEYNDLSAVAEVVEEYKGEIAAIILEPIAGNMGLVMPKSGFLPGLRDICDRENILLLFDEVMTGFRVAKGGCTQLFAIEPDMVILGKIIGGGLPVGCFGARTEIMNELAPVGGAYQAGTLSGNPLAMSAGIATLQKLRDDKIQQQITETAAYLTNALKEEADRQGIPFYAISCGGMWGFGFREKAIENYQDAMLLDQNYFQAFFKEMLMQNIYLPPSRFEAMFLSAAHSQEDIEKTIVAFAGSLKRLSAKGLSPH